MVDGSAGGGVVNATVTGKQELVSVTIDPSASTPTTSRCSRTSSSPRSTTRCGASRELAEAEDGGGDRRPAPPGDVTGAVATPLIEPVARLIESFARLPGIGPEDRATADVPPAARPGSGGADAGRRAYRRPRQGRVLRSLLQHQRPAALPDLPRPGPRPAPAVRRRGAARRPGPRADRRVQGPAITSSTARSRRSTGSAPTGCGSASCSRGPTRPRATASRSSRSSWLRTRRSKARRPRCTLRSASSPSSGRSRRIARGLPVGGDLEYADEVTLIRALQGRRAV